MRLTSQAGRVALILAMIDTMKCATANPITVTDLEKIADDEVQTKPRLKPVHLFGIDHPSTIAAAHWLAHNRKDLWVNSKAALRQDAHAVMENLRNRVKNWCNLHYTPAGGYADIYWI